MKQRRSFFKKLAAGIGAVGLSSSVWSATLVQKPVAADFLHIVFIWLKDPEKDLVAYIERTKEFVKQVPVIVDYHIGVPAATDRPIVDNSYSLCLTVGFKDIEGHNIYQDHPVHKAYVESSKELWDKVLIYDSTR